MVGRKRKTTRGTRKRWSQRRRPPKPNRGTAQAKGWLRMHPKCRKSLPRHHRPSNLRFRFHRAMESPREMAEPPNNPQRFPRGSNQPHLPTRMALSRLSRVTLRLMAGKLKRGMENEAPARLERLPASPLTRLPRQPAYFFMAI
jgi:hypothetical protein